MQTDSAADYDEVVSHSTLDDTTPQTSSESNSMSEVPSESRFKTFVKQKNKGSASQMNRYNHIRNQTASEDTDNEPSTSLLNERCAPDRMTPAKKPSVSSARDHNVVESCQQFSSETESAYHHATDEGEEEHDEEEDEDDDEEEEEDDDAEEGVYELSGGNVTGTGRRQQSSEHANNSNNNSIINNHDLYTSYHRHSSSQDSNGNSISIAHHKQSRPMSEHNQLKSINIAGGNSRNNLSLKIPENNNHRRSRSNESTSDTCRQGDDM